MTTGRHELIASSSRSLMGEAASLRSSSLINKRKSTALFHSRISYAFGSGHDLSINLIDIKRSESSMFTYNLPKNSTSLAGKRDGWDVEEFEVFVIEGPIKESRYEDIKTSLHHLAKAQLASDGLIGEEDPNEFKLTETVIESNDAGSLKGEVFEEELSEDQDSILDHSFLYKNLVKDVHLMNKEQLLDYNRAKHQEKQSSLMKEL